MKTKASSVQFVTNTFHNRIFPQIFRKHAQNTTSSYFPTERLFSPSREESTNYDSIKKFAKEFLTIQWKSLTSSKLISCNAKIKVLKRFGILKLQNQVTKPSYAKWRHTLSYSLENFYRNSSLELLTRLYKILNKISS